jgi:hypothetical protein
MQGASPNSEKKSVAAQPIASPIHLEHVIGPPDMFSLYPDLNKYEKGQVTSKDFRGKRRKQLEPVLSPKNVEQKRIKIYIQKTEYNKTMTSIAQIPVLVDKQVRPMHHDGSFGGPSSTFLCNLKRHSCTRLTDRGPQLLGST